MATVTLGRIPRGILDDQATNLINQQLEEIEWLLTGNLDVKNIKAKGITAEKIKVDELSAISANLGTIIAGLLQAVTIIGSVITGSLIQTSESSYPRVELKSDDHLLKAASTIDRVIEMLSSFLGYPIFRIKDETGMSAFSYKPDTISSIPSLFINSDSQIAFNPSGHVYFRTGLFSVFFQSWNNIINNATSQSLQQALNAKQNVISGYTGSFSTGTKTVTVVNGIITSVM